MFKPRHTTPLSASLAVSLLLSATVLHAQPRGEAPKELPKIPPPDATAAQVPDGYRVEIAVSGLTYPTSIEFDGGGNMYIAESGYAYGDNIAPCRVWRIDAGGKRTIVADQLSAPITDLLWHDGRLYISHRGKISALEAGTVRDLVTDLPSWGDHHNNQLAAGPDGKLYFGEGTATNSGVVGIDNFVFGWLHKYPSFHDVPAHDIRLRRRVFEVPDPLWAVARNQARFAATSAYHAFGTPALEGTVVKGNVRSNGTILRMNADGSNLEVYAWGLRNPFGVMWGPDGNLYTADNGFDERGSRPIANALDCIFAVKQGGWYGFPDFNAGIPVTDRRFKSERGAAPEFLLAKHPPVEKPVLTRPNHAGVTKMDFSRNARFGFEGQMFLGEVGSVAPATGENTQPAGFQVVRINPATREAQPFFHAKPSALGPKGWEYTATAGPKRPVDVRFSPQGDALYVADVGAIGIILTGAGPVPYPFPETGVIWRITRS